MSTRPLLTLPILFLMQFVLSWSAVAEENEFDDEEEAALPLSTVWEIDFTRKFQIDVFQVSEDNTEFGKYNGLNENGVHAAASWEVVSRPNREDKNDTRYWTLSVDDLGLSTLDIEFGIGKQGNYGLEIDFSTLTTVGNDTGVTPFLGTNVLTLPTNWVAAPITSGMTSNSSFDQFEPELKRNRLQVSLNKHFDDKWTVDAGYVYEEKKGEKVIGAAFYIDAANPHSALLPEPVDYTTIEFDLAVDYGGEKLQFGLSYHVSNFDNEANEDRGLTWQNPYTSVFGAADYPDGFGTIGLSPDHQFQQVRARGTYLFSPKIRLQFDGSHGTTEYRDSLSPYTVNPALTVHTPLPVTRLDDLDTSTFYIALLTNPFRRVSLNFKYRYEERDNTMGRYPWLYVRGDAQDQPDAGSAVFNNPQNTTKEKFTSEVSWRMRNRTRFTLAYDFEEVSREGVSVNETEEDKFTGTVKLYPADKVSIRFEYAYADRAASTYQWAESFLNRYSEELIDLTPANRRWSNHPLLRQSYLASRESSFAKINISYSPMSKLSLALDADYRDHDYDKSDLGLTDDKQAMFNLSGNFIPFNAINIYGWGNYGIYDTSQNGRSFRGGIDQPANEVLSPLAQGSDPSRNWEVDEKTETFSFGGGLDWVVKQDKFEISADYTYMRTMSEFDIGTYGATDILGVPLPDRDNMIHHFNLTANYYAKTNLNWRLTYQYYRTRPLYETATTVAGQHYLIKDDWATAGLDTDTLDKVLTLGRSSPDEVVNVISLSVIYRY